MQRFKEKGGASQRPKLGGAAETAPEVALPARPQRPATQPDAPPRPAAVRSAGRASSQPALKPAPVPQPTRADTASTSNASTAATDAPEVDSSEVDKEIPISSGGDDVPYTQKRRDESMAVKRKFDDIVGQTEQRLRNSLEKIRNVETDLERFLGQQMEAARSKYEENAQKEEAQLSLIDQRQAAVRQVYGQTTTATSTLTGLCRRACPWLPGLGDDSTTAGRSSPTLDHLNDENDISVVSAATSSAGDTSMVSGISEDDAL